MWCTSGGNTGSRLGASLIGPPEATDARTLSMAFSIVLLPDVLPVTEIASSIGTPAVTSDDRVRDQRASAIFWAISPIFSGNFSLRRSHCERPLSVIFQRVKLTTMATAMPTRTYG